MQKDKLIILDTNFIIANFKSIKELKNNYKTAIPQMVLNEIKAQEERRIDKIYNEIESKAKENAEYIKININSNKEQIIKKRKQIIEDRYVKEVDLIIPNITEGNILDKVIERVHKKMPPFYNEQNSSDKGFKDTLILLDIIQFINETEYKNIYLVTFDNGFTKYREIIQEEVEAKTGKKFEVIDNLDNERLKIENKIQENESVSNSDLNFEINVDTEIIVRKDINILKENLQLTVKEIIGDRRTVYHDENFVLTNIINEKKVIEFIENIPNVLGNGDNLFFDELYISEFLEPVGFTDVVSHKKIRTSCFDNLYELYNEIKDSDFYKNAFIKYVKEKMNEKYDKLYNTELPF